MCFTLEYCNAPVSHNLETHNLPPRIPTVTNQKNNNNNNIPFNRSNLLSLNRFFGNIPLTALFNTSPPPHFRIILSILKLFITPGLVVRL